MRLFRAVSYAELQDILFSGVLRPGPPSFQGKWLAEFADHAAEWGRALYQSVPFHLIEVEVLDAEANTWFRLANLDSIGPALFADIPDLPRIAFIGEVPVPTGGP
jgi:hypothetical protein